MIIHRYFTRYIIFCLFTGMLACVPEKTKLPVQDDGSNQTSLAYEQALSKSRDLINDRKHLNALKLLEQAGRFEPQRPEWQYERARALSSMDRFEESVSACHQSLERDPEFYDARGLSWAAQLEVSNRSEEMRQNVRQAIDTLLKQSGNDIGALMTVYQGYSLLKDLPAQQKMILRLAEDSMLENEQQREQVAAELYEQIIQEKNDSGMQMKLMDAYIKNFSQRRFVEDIVNLLLKKKLEAEPEKVKPEIIIPFILKTYPKSRRINTGIARWLIDQDKMLDEASQLLQDSLSITEKNIEEKPPYFTDELWADELDREKDFMHYLLGQAYFNMGNFKKAKTELTMVANKNRHWGKVYHLLGMIALIENNHEEAISYFRQALVIDEYQEKTKKKLMTVLAKYHRYQGDPVGYFLEESSTIHFENVTKKNGMGGQKSKRVAWGDYNNDGLVDLLIDGHRLFRNTGIDTFIEVTKETGLDLLTAPTGGVWGDYDNDGFLDIFIMDHSGNHLFRNDRNGKFIDMTEPALWQTEPRQTEAAAWGDLDNDGFLDIYVANYERPGVMRAIGVQDQLYHNNGNGTFSDISLTSGINTDEAMCGRGVTWTDVNRDGYQDIVVANYRLDPNFLWINVPPGNLKDQAEIFNARGNNVEGAFGHSVGPVSGDLDNDGIVDLFISNLAHPRYIQYSDQNMLLISRGTPDYHFADQYAFSGIAFEETNSDPALADVDNDGDLDLYITSIYPGRYSHLYLNDGKGSFTDITWLSGTSVENSWGAAFADYNNDGYVDLAVASENGLRLFRNNGTSNHWIKIKIKDSNCNTHGIGASVTINYAGNQQVREITAGRGTGSQDDDTLIFGLGAYKGPIKISARTLCGEIIQTTAMCPDQTVILFSDNHQ